MNATDYYHNLPGEQGDPLEASLAYGMGIYANWLLPSDIANSTVVIARRMIDGARCAGGRIGTVQYDRFERLLNRKADSGYTWRVQLLARQFDVHRVSIIRSMRNSRIENQLIQHLFHIRSAL